MTLSATFYESSPTYPKASKADVIIPLSNMEADQGNYFSVPPSFSVSTLSLISSIFLVSRASSDLISGKPPIRST